MGRIIQYRLLQSENQTGLMRPDRTDEYTKCRKGSRWACHIYGKGMQEEW